MKRIKYSIQSIFTALLVVVIFVAVSCSNEIPEKGQSTEVIRMKLEGGLQEFDDAATRAPKTLPDGAKILIRFANGAYATATYSTSSTDWSVSLTGSLSSTSSGECTLFYSPAPKSLSGSSLTLDSSTPLYTAQGTYSYSSPVLKVTATLVPSTPRVRFKGAPGITISLSGLTYYSGVDVSKSSPLSTTPSDVLLTVSGSYTDYVYGYFANSNRELKLTVNRVTYKRTFDASFFTNGKSGYMDIPTSSALGKWKKGGTTFEYVDMGLSVMWATCNVGADDPEEYGDYFAWGETEGYMDGKTDFSWQTYKWCNGVDEKMTKYCTQTVYGTVDYKTVLDPEDDVAHVKWGGNWRMPTDEEFTELRDKCTWKWTERNGIYGCLITSNTNGNSIFLPAAGFYNNTHYFVGSIGRYWSSSLSTIGAAAYGVVFSSDPNDSKNAASFGRCEVAQSVRPVWTEVVRVRSINITASESKMNVGESLQLFAEITPSNATYKSVQWSSQNTDVAIVSQNGLVTAKQEGTATITATAKDGSGVKGVYWLQVQAPTPTDEHEAVDLGLSVKWATCNVGASAPENYGDYFSWGETSGYKDGKKNFYWDSYKWMANYECNKYQTEDGQTSSVWYKNGTFVGDNKTVLESEDDVARVYWGGQWRMPTDSEFSELHNTSYCTWTWTAQNGVDGYRVTSKKNGKSIFLPAAGYHYLTYSYAVGSDGHYWSRSLSYFDTKNACYLGFYSDNVYCGSKERYYGHSVRPVHP